MRQRALIPLLIVSLIANAAFLAFLFLSPRSPLRSEASLQGDVATGEIQVSQPALIRTGTVTNKQDRTLTIDETDFGSTEVTYDQGVIVRSLNANNEFELTDDGKLSNGDVVSITYTSAEGKALIQSIDILDNK